MRRMIKPVVFLGDTRKRLRAFPEDAKAVAGSELLRVQRGEEPRDAKSMTSVGVGVREIRVQLGEQYRVIYVAKFEEAVYVLHCFQKKTQQTAPTDVDLARRRFNALVKERTVL